ncbi:hypothetical protein D3C80_2021250 [compost metagenome]
MGGVLLRFRIGSPFVGILFPEADDGRYGYKACNDDGSQRAAFQLVAFSSAGANEEDDN